MRAERAGPGALPENPTTVPSLQAECVEVWRAAAMKANFGGGVP